MDVDTIWKILTVLHSFMAFERKAILVLRLEGAAERFFDCLSVPKLQHSIKVTTAILEITSLMCKRTEHVTFFNALHKLNAVSCVVEIVRMHCTAIPTLQTQTTLQATSALSSAGAASPPTAGTAGVTKLLRAAILVLERLISKSEKLLTQALSIDSASSGSYGNGSGLIVWALTALHHPKLDDKTANSVLRILKVIIRSTPAVTGPTGSFGSSDGPTTGLNAFLSFGGFDTVYPALTKHFDKPLTVRVAASLLWMIQSRQYAQVVSSLPVSVQIAYNTDSCGFEADALTPPVPNEDSIAFPTAASGASADASAPAVHPMNTRNVTSFDVADFSPELWDPSDSQTLARLAEMRRAISAAATVKSLTRFETDAPGVNGTRPDLNYSLSGAGSGGVGSGGGGGESLALPSPVLLPPPLLSGASVPIEPLCEMQPGASLLAMMKIGERYTAGPAGQLSAARVVYEREATLDRTATPTAGSAGSAATNSASAALRWRKKRIPFAARRRSTTMDAAQSTPGSTARSSTPKRFGESNPTSATSSPAIASRGLIRALSPAGTALPPRSGGGSPARSIPTTPKRDGSTVPGSSGGGTAPPTPTQRMLLVQSPPLKPASAVAVGVVPQLPPSVAASAGSGAGSGGGGGIPTLQFESSFESGNLHRAIQLSDTEYDLLLSTDINTHRQTQWFYFRVNNTRAGVAYTFNVVNLEKPRAVFSNGMKPVVRTCIASHVSLLL